MRRSFVIALFLLLGATDLLLTWQVFDLPCPMACATDLPLRREWTESHLYAAELDRLAGLLVARRLKLHDAAAELDLYLQGRDYDALAILSTRFDGLSDQECLALVLLRRAASQRGDQAAANRETLAWLERDFAEHYGVPLPANARGEDSGRFR